MHILAVVLSADFDGPFAVLSIVIIEEFVVDDRLVLGGVDGDAKLTGGALEDLILAIPLAIANRGYDVPAIRISTMKNRRWSWRCRTLWGFQVPRHLSWS